ncbi:BamA/TamA family outer membrane protein [Hyphococcus formosus]|uniref:autotransporter assembly complex protein TamA n=1 Tax=Hyphococcus formosus TaxID=3143534 RepID=UPI00398ACC08
MRRKRQSIVISTISSALLLAAASHGHAAESYSAKIEGAPNGVGAKLSIISELMKGTREYPTAAALRRAARRDIDAFNNALQSAGYYDAQASFELIPAEDGQKPQVIYSISPGPAFRVTEYNIIYQDDGTDRPDTLADANITPTGAADGATLRDQQESFLSYLWNNGFPTAEIVNRRAIANFETAEASAIFVFNSGPKASFGEPVIRGTEKTDNSFLARMKTWEIGEEFERAKMANYYDRLRETGLFATVEVEPGQFGEDGLTPILVDVEERKNRTIGAGVSYSTTEGPGGRLFFEHRNIFGHGENLTTELTGSQIEQSVNVSISRPLPRLGARAFASSAFLNETTDAYDARTFEILGGLSKKWLDGRLETRGALKLETSNVRSADSEDRTYFVSTPLSVLWNSEDDLLDPKKGFRASWTVTPYAGSENFTQSEITARGRVNFGKNDVVTLAARTGLAATFANSFDALPLNKRYYAGGAGSVRGYGYQEAGPLDEDLNPIGGRSRIDGAFEARVKTIKNLQFAAFIDAGSVSTNAVPSFNDEFFFGYGAGVRYYTPIGPIRADIAFPIDKRESDSDFQIYIALGQPF